MTVHNFPLFPTLVQVVDNFLTYDQCLNIVSFLEQQKYRMSLHGVFGGEAITSHHGNNSKPSMELDVISSNVTGCGDIKERVQNAVNDYSREVGFPVNNLDNSWVNFQGKDSILKEHAHGRMSLVSGALFLQSDDQSSKLFFHNPNPHIEGIENKSQQNSYMWDNFYIEPIIGYLVLFPGWLKHGSNYTRNNSEQRVVLSFNTI
jgi:uncharacterized protein (TIGR02466 family)